MRRSSSRIWRARSDANSFEARHPDPSIGEVPVAGGAAQGIVVVLGRLALTPRVALARLVAGLLILAVALLHLLHLLGHALHAAPQVLEGATLGIHRGAVLALADGVLGLPHGLLRVAEPALVLHAHAAHLVLQLPQPIPQRLLALPEAERPCCPPCSPLLAVLGLLLASPCWPC